jgi:hypothetical protein
VVVEMVLMVLGELYPPSLRGDEGNICDKKRDTGELLKEEKKRSYP